MITVAVANQKGGVSKTTTAHNLAAGLRDKGFRVLGVDLDPQGNFSDACGAQFKNVYSSYEVLKRTVGIREAIQSLPRGYDFVPANTMLAGIEQQFSSELGKEFRLEECLAEVAAVYDYAVIDTPPSLGILTVNALFAANQIIIPTTARIFSASGIASFNETVSAVKKYAHHPVEIRGILITQFDSRANLNKQIRTLTERIGEHISAPVFSTCIRTGVAMAEAQANHTDIFDYNPKCTVAQDYQAFINEFVGEV